MLLHVSHTQKKSVLAQLLPPIQAMLAATLTAQGPAALPLPKDSNLDQAAPGTGGTIPLLGGERRLAPRGMSPAVGPLRSQSLDASKQAGRSDPGRCCAHQPSPDVEYLPTAFLIAATLRAPA
jgi:uncharacterized SAM-binding protein YcdF (DUF218 family)